MGQSAALIVSELDDMSRFLPLMKKEKWFSMIFGLCMTVITWISQKMVKQYLIMVDKSSRHAFVFLSR